MKSKIILLSVLVILILSSCDIINEDVVETLYSIKELDVQTVAIEQTTQENISETTRETATETTEITTENVTTSTQTSAENPPQTTTETEPAVVINDSEAVSLTVDGIEYTLHGSEFITTRDVPDEAIGYLPGADENGNLAEYDRIIVAEMTFKNITDEQIVFMANNAKIMYGEVEDNKPVNLLRSVSSNVAYFAAGKNNTNQKRIMEYTLAANESVTSTVIFCFREPEFQNFDKAIFCINPTGTFPPSDRAKAVPIKLTLGDENE